MSTLFERIIILLLCSALMPASIESAPRVLSVFAATAFCTFAMYFENRWNRLLLCVIYSIICFIMGSPYCIFYPLVIYETVLSQVDTDTYRVLFNRRIIFALFFIGLFLVLTDKYAYEQSLLLFFITLLAIYLAVRCSTRIKKDRELLTIKDTKRELELLIAERQESFVQQQDYEVHVATLRERNRIAREIHDNVGHLLSRSLLIVGALNARNRDEGLRECVTDLKDTLSGAMDSIRSSIHDLHDESIDLEDSIRTLLRGFSFCPVTLDYDMSGSVGKDIKYCFVSIIKEALSNISRHSNATKAVVVLREHERLYQLLIDDNGTVSEASDERGIGLENMQERVNALKGTIYFRTQKGFRIFVTIPKKQ